MARPVRFAHCLPDRDSATAFGESADALGFAVAVSAPAGEIRDWQVVCTFDLIPTHRDVSRTQMILARLVREHGGHEDGWGVTDEA